TVAVMQVPDADVSKYGIIEIGKIVRDGFFKVKSVVEKPKVEAAPSRWALPGRYVFDGQILDYLKETKPGYGGEIQLTDAMGRLANENGLNATEFSATRFDAGDKLGYLQANVELALMNPELSGKAREYILRLAEKIR
ncbi:MAG: sugar phosphate nucleotidyltransferase, partial [Pseudobdellovibrionaceae bacterium]